MVSSSVELDIETRCSAKLLVNIKHTTNHKKEKELTEARGYLFVFSMSQSVIEPLQPR